MSDQAAIQDRGTADPALVAAAATLADAVAEQRGVRVEELAEASTHHDATALLRRIWGVGGSQQLLDPGLSRALAHAGNYVVAAYRGDAMAGAGVGFFAVDGHLHSHIVGVASEHQGQGIGYAIKLHQRAWALARGVTRVSWTFDPLVRRNAHFNVQKLGAQPTEYLADFYGPMTDAINAGTPTDRLYVTWDLGAPRVVAAVSGDAGQVDAAGLRAAGAHVLVDRDGDEPLPAPTGQLDGTSPALVAIPGDVERLRSARPEWADRWRDAVRGALTDALSRGYRVTGVARDGWYVLEPEPSGA